MLHTDKFHYRVNSFHNKRKNSIGKDRKKFCKQSLSNQSFCYENRCCLGMFITAVRIGINDSSHLGCENIKIIKNPAKTR